MNRHRHTPNPRGPLLRAALLACALLLACNDLGGGGGGGGGGINFTQGYVFVRPDDQNLSLADVSDLTQLAALTTTGGAQQPSLSPNGKQVVYVHRTETGNELAVVSTSGGTPSTLLPADGTHPNARSPVFSADGATVFFVYDAQEGARLASVGTSGQGAVDLTSGGRALASPSVLPDGSVLAITGSSSAQLTQLVRVDPTTGEVTDLTPVLENAVNGVSNRVVASPDGTRAVLDGRPSGGGAARIYVIDLRSFDVTLLSDHPGEPNAIDSFPTWVGPETVAFTSDLGGAPQLYTTPANAALTAGQLTLPSATMAWFGP